MTEYKSHYMVNGVEFSEATEFESFALSAVEKEWLGQRVKKGPHTLEGVVIAQAPEVGSVWVFYPDLQEFHSHPCKNLVKVGVSEMEPLL